MNALQEVIHSARELVNEHRHAYPPVWAKDANKIIDEAAAELAALRARLEAVEALAKKWQNKNKYAADVVICGEELAAALKVLK